MSSEAGPDTGARPDGALLRLIHQLLVVRTSGKLADHQRGYPRWELANAELRSLLEAGVGGVILLADRFAKTSNSNILTTISGAAVGAGISIHAMLHGLEAPKDASTLLWWSGALVSSVLVCGGTYLLQKKLPITWTKAAAIAFLAIGGLLAFGPLGLLAGGAGA